MREICAYGANGVKGPDSNRLCERCQKPILRENGVNSRNGGVTERPSIRTVRPT